MSYDNAIRELQGFVNSGRIPHAFCYVGGCDNSGNSGNSDNSETFPEYAARLILCDSKNAKPCNICNSCKKAREKIHPDIIRAREIMPDGKYKVDALRKIVADSTFRPNDGVFAVYIFEGADEMSHICQNALLKFTEEPPEHVKIIFTAREPDAFLETIKSRLVFINAEAGNYSYDNISDEIMETTRLFASAVAKADEYLAAAALSRIKTRDELSQTLSAIGEVFRNALLLKSGANLAGTEIANNLANNLAGSLSLADLAKAQKFIAEKTEELRHNPNVTLAGTVIVSEFCSF